MKAILAADKNWGIGYNNRLLVSIPSDMKFFRQTTTGKVVVMGRKTLESFPNGLPLKNRTNIVLTANPDYDVKDAVIVHSKDELLEELKKYNEDDIYVIGGESVYRMMLPYCDTVLVTKIDRAFQADTHFPNLDEMEEGDCFYLHVLDEILAYRVDQIKVVEPNETGDLDIIAGEDYCTLVTCTPYSINTHRLLVRGVRTEYNGELESDVQYQELQTGTLARRLIDVLPWLLVVGTVAIGTEGVLLWLLIRRKKKRDREEL